jgi:hypothetical protein
MAEADFTDINIIGNSASKLPRKDGNNKVGKDQFIITFDLSSSATRPWVEIFNRVWGELNGQTPALHLPVVSDAQIQITCPLDDRLQGHLDLLKREVATTNRRYREQLREIDEEKRSNDKILQNLVF